MPPHPAQLPPAPPAAEHKTSPRVWLVAALLVLAAVAAYHRTFSAPFVFDDMGSISFNSSIRRLDTALFPPNTNGETVSGRPLVNASLALNYAISGTRVWSYHALNLLIHVCAGLALFGLARRTFLLPSLRDRTGNHALPLSAAIAALWLLHPLQTESVTYVVQRAESLMALFYLLTLYCFARGAERPGQKHFLFFSAIFCLLGMASKEVMVSAPLIVLLYDRAFVAGSFRAAFAGRRVYYASLAATWIVFAWLAINTNSRGSTAGFGLEVSPWAYLLTQAKAIPHYLRLAIWPAGLTFDYGKDTVKTLAAVWPQALLVLALLGATVWANIRHPKTGFPAALFFAALAPSSSFVPVTTQTMAEHRMYLPLAAVITIIAVALWRVMAARRAIAIFALMSAALLALTISRNEVYANSSALWQDTVAKAPDNPRAHSNLSAACIATGKNFDLAIAHAQTAIGLEPDSFQAYNNLGYAQYKLGRYDDALANYNIALQTVRPGNEIAYNNRGTLYYQLGRYAESVADLQKAIALQPLYTEAYSNLGNSLFALHRNDEAMRALDTALGQNPDFAAAWNNRGNILAGLAIDMDEAFRCYKHADQLEPGKWEYIDNIARLLVFLNRPAESLPYWRAALPLAPDATKAHYGLANALMLAGRVRESIPEYEETLRLDPNFTPAREQLKSLQRQ